MPATYRPVQGSDMPKVRVVPFDPHMVEHGVLTGPLTHFDTYEWDREKNPLELAMVLVCEELPDHLRDALFAVGVAGLGFREAGVELGISDKTAKARYVKAAEYIKNRLLSSPFLASLIAHKLPEPATAPSMTIGTLLGALTVRTAPNEPQEAAA